MKKICDIVTIATVMIAWMSAVYVLGMLVLC